MTCPTCHRIASRQWEAATSSGLVSMCPDPFHANALPPAHAEPVSVSPVGPEDFVRQEPDAAVMWLTRPANIHIDRGPLAGTGPLAVSPGWVADEVLAAIREQWPHVQGLLSDVDPNGKRYVRDRHAHWPFQEDPPKLIPADNGWRYCSECEQPVEAKGHECAPPMGFDPDWVSSPGDTIRDCAAANDISDFRLAQLLGMGPRELSDFLDETHITLNLAGQLSLELGGSIDFWLTRDRQYREGPNYVANSRAEFAESLLCAMAFSVGQQQTSDSAQSFDQACGAAMRELLGWPREPK
jgi:plasmid maintenance system antidote protein VapI